MSRKLWIAFALLALLLSACSAVESAQAFTQVGNDFMTDLKNGEYESAYALLHPNLQQEVGTAADLQNMIACSGIPWQARSVSVAGCRSRSAARWASKGGSAMSPARCHGWRGAPPSCCSRTRSGTPRAARISSKDSTKWIVANRDSRRIAYAIHLGDITAQNTPSQWEVARRALGSLADQVPYVLIPGNHDYSGPDRRTLLNEYFPVDGMKRWSSFGGVFDEGHLEDSYHLFAIGGRPWIVLGQEFGPRDEVVRWADQILSRHPDRLAIADGVGQNRRARRPPRRLRVVARRSGAEWYVGAMTDWTPRELDVDLSFLPAGAFRMEVWADGVNANRWGEDTRRTTTEVTSASSVRIRMAEGGGWVARIRQPHE